jgi:hypothetical protein
MYDIFQYRKDDPFINDFLVIVLWITVILNDKYINLIEQIWSFSLPLPGQNNTKMVKKWWYFDLNAIVRCWNRNGTCNDCLTGNIQHYTPLIVTSLHEYAILERF